MTITLQTARHPVNQQLPGKNILITGTTSFSGKVVLEKLIRKVPEIDGIYLLIRSSRQRPNARQRFLAAAEQLSSPALHRVYLCCSGSRALTLSQLVSHLMTESKENHMTYKKPFESKGLRQAAAGPEHLRTYNLP